METGNLKDKKHIVRFKLNKDDPIDDVQFNSATAAYLFANRVEENGGIAIVRSSEEDPSKFVRKLNWSN